MSVMISASEEAAVNNPPFAFSLSASMKFLGKGSNAGKPHKSG